MSVRHHGYRIAVDWTGNRGTGTSAYTAYGRDHRVQAAGKADILGSADPKFRGDAALWNPEEMLIAAAATCHQLWYLHLCADAKVVVTEYRDAPEGIVQENADGSGWFVSITLRPNVTLAVGSDAASAMALHEAAHAKCFVANSVNFEITCAPTIRYASD